MSEREEYTPTMDELVDAYTYCIGPDVRQRRRAEALRAIAAHDREVREQIAQDIREQRIVCPVHGIPDCSPLLNGCSRPRLIHSTVEACARIARGEGSE